MGRQSKRHPALVPEFRQVCLRPAGAALGPGQRLLNAKPTGGSGEGAASWKVGFLHTPVEFVAKALASQHPVDSANPLSAHFLEALDTVMSHSPVRLELLRKLAITRAEVLAKQTAASERHRHDCLPAHMKGVLANKNFTLFEALLQKYGFWDMGVVALLEKGVDLLGLQETPPCYPSKVVPATISVEEFRSSAVWRRKCLTSPSALEVDAEQLDHLRKACG